ncbi:Bifunctional epoxide hydrolase 2 [Colletotrichum spinosum]|uniref:Bifunctional epoxide hydrolase 2 n=1 Tax=Colletotrichum spinosum TaxID=1347390 RepID=A0A4R8PRC6_9PEZI|nr:Bifunctional epoxide hydrolase 2 [Colletotrichum spinosum]
MDLLVNKQFINSRSLQYNYYVSPSSNASTGNPALVLLHGFPDSAAIWAPLVPILAALGFRLLIPDMLGYGGTSKPWDVSYFNSSAMASDIMEILDFENIGNFISIGHDWGSFMAHRLYIWHPDRVDALAVAAYNWESVLRTPTDIEAQAAEFERTLGWPVKHYYSFLAGPDAARLLTGHPESFMAAGYGTDNNMNVTFGRRDGLKNWLAGDKRTSLQSWARDPVVLETVKASFQGDGFVSPLNWYRALVENVHMEVENVLPADADNVKVPFLLIGGEQDPVCPPAIFDNPKILERIPDFTKKVFDAGHFLPTEKPVEMAETISDWLKSKGIAPKGR